MNYFGINGLSEEYKARNTPFGQKILVIKLMEVFPPLKLVLDRAHDSFHDFAVRSKMKIGNAMIKGINYQNVS